MESSSSESVAGGGTEGVSHLVNHRIDWTYVVIAVAGAWVYWRASETTGGKRPTNNTAGVKRGSS